VPEARVVRGLAVVLVLAFLQAPSAAAQAAEVDDQTPVCLEPEAAERALRTLETRPDLVAALDTLEAVDVTRRTQVRTATTTGRDLLETNRVLVEEVRRKGPPEWMLVGLGVLVGGAAVGLRAWASN
jgi:hypothetical protein